MGFVGQRPEHQFRVGPDVLWLIENDYAFVIECKSRKEAKNALTKDEHGQLLVAKNWFSTEYPERKAAGIVAHPNSSATEPAAAENAFALTLTNLDELVAATKEVLFELCRAETPAAELEKRCALLLEEHKLNHTGLVSHFLKAFTTLKGKPA